MPNIRRDALAELLHLLWRGEGANCRIVLPLDLAWHATPPPSFPGMRVVAQMTDEQRKTLAGKGGRWLPKLRKWLSPYISEDNMRQVMRQVTKLCSGAGVRCKCPRSKHAMPFGSLLTTRHPRCFGRRRRVRAVRLGAGRGLPAERAADARVGPDPDPSRRKGVRSHSWPRPRQWVAAEPPHPEMHSFPGVLPATTFRFTFRFASSRACLIRCALPSYPPRPIELLPRAPRISGRREHRRGQRRRRCRQRRGRRGGGGGGRRRQRGGG